MQFMLDGQAVEFTTIRDFRHAYGLPAEFGVARFEPKDYNGLGRIDRAGAELNQVRAAVLAALPERLPMREWLAFVPGFNQLFEQQLYQINSTVGLKDVEVDFAVAGFSDVCQAVVYALVRARSAGTLVPEFRSIYSEWLNSTIRLFTSVYIYDHAGANWEIQLVAHAYGRMGLLIHMPDAQVAVYDPALACPAEGFMTALLGEVASRIIAATV